MACFAVTETSFLYRQGLRRLVENYGYSAHSVERRGLACVRSVFRPKDAIDLFRRVGWGFSTYRSSTLVQFCAAPAEPSRQEAE